SIHWDRDDDEQAIACCTEAARHFPQFQGILERLDSQREARAEERRHRLEQARIDQAIAEQLSRARAASQDARDAEAIAICQEVLAQRPDDVDAMALAAFSYQRLARLDDALVLYETLAELEPANPVWSQWVGHLRTRRRLTRLTGRPVAAEYWDSAED